MSVKVATLLSPYTAELSSYPKYVCVTDSSHISGILAEPRYYTASSAEALLAYSFKTSRAMSEILILIIYHSINI